MPTRSLVVGAGLLHCDRLYRRETTLISAAQLSNASPDNNSPPLSRLTLVRGLRSRNYTRASLRSDISRGSLPSCITRFISYSCVRIPSVETCSSLRAPPWHYLSFVPRPSVHFPSILRSNWIPHFVCRVGSRRSGGEPVRNCMGVEFGRPRPCQYDGSVD